MATPIDIRGIAAAQVVLPIAQLDATVNFFTTRLGFRVDAIFPADHPTIAVLSGHGLTVRLQPGDTSAAGELRLLCGDPAVIGGDQRVLRAPNGTIITLVDTYEAMAVPPVAQSLVVCRMADDASWGTGRAGMQYRDIIPGRQGGRFIGSHIRIPHGGPVPDYVHYHRVRFQMIYVHRGWVRLVYEDQGEPFVMHAGDCVLQPPEIRHRVLDSGDGLEVIELGCPAEHETRADHEMTLPTGRNDPRRSFGVQRFVRHEVATAAWLPWDRSGIAQPGFEHRDLGIADATDGCAGVRVVRAAGGGGSTVALAHAGEFMFGFVLAGTMHLDCAGPGGPVALGDADTFVIPAGMVHRWTNCSEDLAVLDVTLPAAPSGSS